MHSRPHYFPRYRASARVDGVTGRRQRIDFRVGDAHGLNLHEGGFDVVVMHTLVSHVADPIEVLTEGRRLLRPDSGRLVVFDDDYASLTFATDAPDGGEATDRTGHAAMVAQPRVMRAMPRLLTAVGPDLWWSRGYLVADIGRADFFAPAVASFRVLHRLRGRAGSRIGRGALLRCEQLLHLHCATAQLV